MTACHSFSYANWMVGWGRQRQRDQSPICWFNPDRHITARHRSRWNMEPKPQPESATWVVQGPNHLHYYLMTFRVCAWAKSCDCTRAKTSPQLYWYVETTSYVVCHALSQRIFSILNTLVNSKCALFRKHLPSKRALQ